MTQKNLAVKCSQPPVPRIPTASKHRLNVRITPIDPVLLSKLVYRCVKRVGMICEVHYPFGKLVRWSSPVSGQPDLLFHWFDAPVTTFDQIRDVLPFAADQVGATSGLFNFVEGDPLQQHVVVLFVPRLEEGITRRLLAEIHLDHRLGIYLHAIVLAPGGGIVLHVPCWNAIEHNDDHIFPSVGSAIASYYPEWEALRGPGGLP